MKHQYIMGVLRSFLKVLGLPEVGRFFLPIDVKYYHELMVDNGPNHIVWMQREAAEQNTDVLQMLPYLVIRDKKGRLFNYQRTKGIGEDRLLGKKSIGVGGHIDLTDMIGQLVTRSSETEHVWSYTANIIELGLQKELSEELSGTEWIDRRNIRPIGFLLDDVQMDDDLDKGKISVGRVHLGVVFEVVVPDVDALRIKENELIQLEPVDISRDDIDYKQYENWSAMLLGFYNVQLNSGFISSDDHLAWTDDALANRGRFYSYRATPFNKDLDLSWPGGRYSLEQFEALEKMVQKLSKDVGYGKIPHPHSPMDQTPWKTT